MRISDFIARTITQRRGFVWTGVGVLTAACLTVLITSLRLDSEIFNVLPGRFPSLQGRKIRDRFHRLRQQIEAGSPRPEFELSFDPLGLITPALKPFAENTATEQEQPLTSPDGTMRVFLAVTNQPSVSAFECQRLMRRV